MGMTFCRTYKCTDCDYLFEGLSGMQDYGDMWKLRFISPMICPKCGNIKNVVSGYEADKKDSICEECNLEMETMQKELIYECPKCHKKSLKCINTDSVYASGKIYIY